MDADFHIIQDILRVSDTGFSLTNLDEVSARKVLQIWLTGAYSDGGASHSPSITFLYDKRDYIITPTAVCCALGIHIRNSHTVFIPDEDIMNFMT